MSADDKSEEPDDLAHEEADVQFEPIVKLEIVEVKTLEESEEPLFNRRARLYRFDKKASEWKERGTGDLKLLKHKETGLVRVLMRRSKTLKICANHRVAQHMELKAHQGSNRTWIYTCHADFADEEPKHEVFAVRFGDKENAEEFQLAFNNARISNSALTDEAPALATEVPSNSSEGEESEGLSEEEEDASLAKDILKLQVKDG